MNKENDFKPLVSVLIPNYNHGAYLAEAIDSVLAQSYKNLEIIVTDNCSTDQSREVIEAYAKADSRVKFKYHSENIGAVRNWKSALDMASGVYCKILFSDDTVEPDFISTGVDVLKDEDIGFYYTAVEGFGVSKKTYFDKRITGAFQGREFIKNICCYVEKLPVSPGCALFRTLDVMRNLTVTLKTPSGIDPCAHGYGSDLLLFLEVAHSYPKCYFDARHFSRFREHASSITVTNQSSRLGNARHHLFYLMAKAHFLSKHSEYKDLMPSFNAICFVILTLFKNNNIGLKGLGTVLDTPLPVLKYYSKIPIACYRLLRIKYTA